MTYQKLRQKLNCTYSGWPWHWCSYLAHTALACCSLITVFFCGCTGSGTFRFHRFFSFFLLVSGGVALCWSSCGKKGPNQTCRSLLHFQWFRPEKSAQKGGCCKVIVWVENTRAVPLLVGEFFQKDYWKRSGCIKGRFGWGNGVKAASMLRSVGPIWPKLI